MNFAAALIAGGRSRRMGQDKAWLIVNGEPLWQRQLRVLRALSPSQLMIAARVEQGLAVQDGVFVADPADADEGPLGAVARCLEQSRVPVLVLAVDMPAITSAVLKMLVPSPQPSPDCSSIAWQSLGRERESVSLSALSNELASPLSDPVDGVVVESIWERARVRGRVFATADHFEPLAALYTPAMLPLLREAIATNQLSLQRLWQRAIEQGLASAVDIPAADAPLFRNVNTPADLAEDKFAAATAITRWHRDEGSAITDDLVAREEPLEIRVGGKSIAVVMRTPGHDRELAAGFLVSEGVVQRADQIVDILKCAEDEQHKGNVVNALLADETLNLDHLTRHVFSASSCGLCGKTSIDSVFQRFPAVQAEWSISPALLWSLPAKLRTAQATFTKTGGLHACAIFNREGELLIMREDVGRHNALDKVLGHALMHGLLPLDQHILILSGRVSFEMMQKALAAGVPIVAAISAPSSLAIEFAKEGNQTLIGFLREPTLNVYAGQQRILPTTSQSGS